MNIYQNAHEKLQEKHSNTPISQNLLGKWEAFAQKVVYISQNLDKIKNTIQFSFIEGVLLEAIRLGHWILLKMRSI